MYMYNTYIHTCPTNRILPLVYSVGTVRRRGGIVLPPPPPRAGRDSGYSLGTRWEVVTDLGNKKLATDRA